MASRSKHIHVSLNQEDLDTLNRLRGDTPMGTFIHATFMRFVAEVEAGVASPTDILNVTPISADSSSSSSAASTPAQVL